MQPARKSEHSVAERLVNISIGPSGLRTARTGPHTNATAEAALCLPVFTQKSKPGG